MATKLILILVLVVLFLSLLGCHTIEGIGRDIEWIGQKGSEAVR